jgi:hypothetical protein
MVLKELKIIERQKGDSQFAELLNRVREGQQTDEDIKLLEGRVIGSPEMAKEMLDPAVLAAVRDSVHLFPTNVQVENHNHGRLTKLLTAVRESAIENNLDPDDPSIHLIVDADDDFAKGSMLKRSTYAGDFQSLLPTDRDKTGGLPERIHLVRGLRVMLRKNVEVKDGLVNGSCGTVVHWVRTGKMAYVKFDPVRGNLVGQNSRTKYAQFLQGDFLKKDKAIVPVAREEATFPSKDGAKRLRRLMLPLVMCWASTVHKAQGMTLERVVIDLSKNTIPAAMGYTALSRVTALKGLFLQGFATGSLKVDPAALMEYDRLRKFHFLIHKENCDCPPGKPCRLEEFFSENSKMNFERSSSPDRACGSSTHGKKRTAVEALGRAVKKLVVPGEAAARKKKKDQHVDGQALISSKGLPPSARRISSLFTGAQRRFTKSYFFRQKIISLQKAVKENGGAICELLGELRGGKLVPLECKARSAQTDQPNTRLLYTCLLKQMRPLSVEPDGNCMFHSFSVLCFGRGDSGHHALFRALALIFVLAFPHHIKAIMLADEMDVDIDYEERYKDLCWNMFRLKSWGEKFSLYALSWVLGRSVHIYTSCFEWDRATESYNVARPKGGLEMDRDLGALREAFALPLALNSPLPQWTDYSAKAAYPPNRLPATIFLNTNHYVPLLLGKGVAGKDLVRPALRCWVEALPRIRLAHPLPDDLDDIRRHFDSL